MSLSARSNFPWTPSGTVMPLLPWITHSDAWLLYTLGSYVTVHPCSSMDFYLNIRRNKKQIQRLNATIENLWLASALYSKTTWVKHIENCKLQMVLNARKHQSKICISLLPFSLVCSLGTIQTAGFKRVE